MGQSHRARQSARNVLAEDRRAWERDVVRTGEPVGHDPPWRPCARCRLVAALLGIASGVLTGAVARDRSTGIAVGTAVAIAVEAGVLGGDRAAA